MWKCLKAVDWQLQTVTETMYDKTIDFGGVVIENTVGVSLAGSRFRSSDATSHFQVPRSALRTRADVPVHEDVPPSKTARWRSVRRPDAPVKRRGVRGKFGRPSPKILRLRRRPNQSVQLYRTPDGIVKLRQQVAE